MTARKTAARRDQANSVPGQMRAMQNAAAGEIKAPGTVNLRPADGEFWSLIIRARAREEWSETDLQHAANLARCFADIERVQQALEIDGDTVANTRGTLIVNPKHQLLEMLTRRSVYLSRLLHIHAGVVMGNPADLGNIRRSENAARETAHSLAHNDDDLLATPSRYQ